MISLPEDVKKIMREQEEGQLKKPILTATLPCWDKHKWKEKSRVQIFEPRDQKVTCPLCGRSHYLIWSKIGNTKYA